MGEFYIFRVEKNDLKQQKRPACLARLLLNQLNSDVLRFTSRVQTCLATNQVVVLQKVESSSTFSDKICTSPLDLS